MLVSCVTLAHICIKVYKNKAENLDVITTVAIVVGIVFVVIFIAVVFVVVAFLFQLLASKPTELRLSSKRIAAT